MFDTPNVVPTMTESMPEETPPATPPASPPTEPVAPATETEKAPVDTPPADQPPTDTPPPTDVPPADTPPAEKLYKLPDGREVNAETLEKEWKENFLPDYTRKSQIVAKIEDINKPEKKGEEEEPAWKKPGWQPSSWQEALEVGRQMTLESIANAAKQEEDAVNAVSTAVESQLTEIKAKDPNLNEGELFAHATKFGFKDLRMAHSNMQAMKEVEVTTEQRVLKNTTTRATIPVAAKPGAAPADGIDLGTIGQFRSAQEFFAHIRGTK